MPQSAPINADTVRLWRDRGTVGPDTYYRDVAVDVCLRCPAEMNDCDVLINSDYSIRKLVNAPRCPLALAVYHGLTKQAAEKLADVLNPDNPLTLVWFERGIRQMVDRENFIKSIKSN